MMQKSGDEQHPGDGLEDDPSPEEETTKHGIPNSATGAGIGATEANSFEPEEAAPPS